MKQCHTQFQAPHMLHITARDDHWRVAVLYLSCGNFFGADFLPDIFSLLFISFQKYRQCKNPFMGADTEPGGGCERDGDDWGLGVNRRFLVHQSGALCSCLQHNCKWLYSRDLDIMRFSVEARDFSCQLQGHFGSSAEKPRMRT